MPRAEGWIGRKLNKDEQGWVSACLQARVNIFETALPIALRGPHKALGADAAELADYTLEEGAFYGNYFDPDAGLYACRGEDEALGDDAGGLALRACAEPDPLSPGLTYCGFEYTGECGNYAPPPGPVCEESPADRNSYYEKCHDQPIVKHVKSEKFKQVITGYALAE